MDVQNLINLVSCGPNAAAVATLGADSDWNVAEDWGLNGWRAVRAPAGIKFQNTAEGLVERELLVVRASEEQRTTYERLAQLARIPVHVVVVEGPHRPCNRLASPVLYLQGGSDE